MLAEFENGTKFLRLGLREQLQIVKIFYRQSFLSTSCELTVSEALRGLIQRKARFPLGEFVRATRKQESGNVIG